MKKHLMLAVVGIAGIALAGQVQAATIFTENFENPVVATVGGGESVWPSGWTTGWGSVGYTIENSDGGHGIDHSQMGYLSYNGGGGAFTTLADTFQANTKYTLSVCVNTDYWNSTWNWAINLEHVDAAGSGGWLAYCNPWGLSNTDGTDSVVSNYFENWKKYTISYTTKADDPVVGQNIRIVANSWAGGRTYIDNISLDATSTVPEPGSIVAMLSGLVGLAGFGIRRKK